MYYKAIIFVEEVYDSTNPSMDIVVLEDEHGLLKYECNHIGSDVFTNAGYDLVNDFKPGRYYEIEYTQKKGAEYYDGFLMNEYATLGEVCYKEYPYWKGEIKNKCFSIKSTLDYATHFLKSIFKPHWTYEAEYGGAGLSRSMYLPKAMWYYLTKKDLGWGKPTKVRFYLG